MQTDNEKLTVWVAACRYHLGRTTGAVSDFTSTLIKEWASLPPIAQEVIQRDVERQFLRDDLAREMKKEHFPLGHDCDRQSWETVRTLWSQNAKVET